MQASFFEFILALLPDAIVEILFVILLLANNGGVFALENCSSSSPHELHKFSGLLIDRFTATNNGSLYNRNVIPVAEGGCNATMTIQVRLFLIRLHDIIENQEELITTVRLQLGWIDPALRWDPKNYGGVTAVMLPAKSIWLPDLHVANTVEQTSSLTLNKGDYVIRVTYKGTVWYYPTVRLATRCALELRFYPFDYQKCAIVIESAHTSRDMLAALRKDKPDAVALGMYSENPMWTLINTTGFPALYKSDHNTAFSRIHFWIVLKRKPDHFQNTFLIPLVLLSALQMLTYLMPMNTIDRVPQATVVMLTAFFLQGYMSDSLPRSDAEPLVQTYLNLIIGVSIITVCVCAITGVIVEPDGDFSLWGIRILYKKYLERKHRNRPISVMINIQDGCNNATSVYDNARLKIPVRRPKLKPSTILVIVINWTAFILCVLVSTVYPLITFVLIPPRSPPPMPQPPPNGITTSYYAEL